MRRVSGIGVTVLCAFALAAISVAQAADPIADRLRQMYPANADAKKEIAEAVQEAAKEHKRVLLVFGATWCFDCFALDYRFRQPIVQPVLDKNYRVVHVDIGQHDKNLDIAQRYKTPIEAVPALAVLDGNGKLVYSGQLHQFSAARNLDPQVIVKFLETWKPSA